MSNDRSIKLLQVESKRIEEWILRMKNFGDENYQKVIDEHQKTLNDYQESIKQLTLNK